ncbi:4Fe-4S cluster-binding domain-containing protein, partial [Geminocystis sp. GBBB08]|uniref:4Fe-4S cluster-binding domain-containing protein n=1 Tax=Geminocystis sp. GBBB08 TaxID=2604140 RepID=UPI0027E2BDCE
GYTLEHLAKHGTSAQKQLLTKIDLLVDGLYMQSLHGDLLWRGSTNQRLLPLTKRYREILTQLPDKSVPLEFSVSENSEGLEIQFTGVPNRVGFREEFEAQMLCNGVVLESENNHRHQ